MTFVRCSALPMFFECPSSVAPTDAPYNPGSGAADTGTAAHELLCHVHDVRSKVTYARITEIARKYDVDAHELEIIVRAGERAWDAIKDDFRNAESEVALDASITGGSTDLRSWDKWHCTIGDWKTGRARKDATLQLTGYAYAHREKHGMPKSGYIRIYAIWLRDGTYDTRDLTDDDLDNFARNYRDRVQQIGKAYAPGDACFFCPRKNECQARRDYLHASTAMIEQVAPAELAPAKLAEVYLKARMVKKLVEHVESVAKLYVSANGELDLGNGEVLRMEETRRESIDPGRAWGVLNTELGFGANEIAKAISVQKTALEKVVKDLAPHGRKSAAWDDAMERLRACGAVRVTTSATMRQKKLIA